MVDNLILTMVEPGEEELLISPPTQAPGNRMQGGALSFQTLEKKIQRTTLCEKSLLPTSCDRREEIQNSNDGWGSITLLCREYSSSRSYPKTKALSAIPEGTIIGPVSEDYVVKILDGYDIELQTQNTQFTL